MAKSVLDNTFDSAVAFLQKKKVKFVQDYEYVGEVGVDRHQEDRPTIRRFQLPFTANEWLDMMSTEGQFLPMCCATISHARDILLARLRDDRYIDCEKAQQFCDLLGGHEGFEFLRGEKEPAKFSKKDPIYRFWQIWTAIKPHANLGLNPSHVPPKNPDYQHPAKRAISIISDASESLYWSLTCSDQDYDLQATREQRLAFRKLMIARILPALKIALERIHELDYGDYDGFAICSKEHPTHILETMIGLCIFQTQSEADKMIDAWDKPQEHLKEPRHENIRELVMIRPVRVSTEKGLVFTDNGEVFDLDHR